MRNLRGNSGLANKGISGFKFFREQLMLPPSPDYATSFSAPEPQHLRPTSRENRATDESARSVSPSSQDSDGDRVIEKRRRNKLAARRLRQRRMDQMSDLEPRWKK